MLVKIFLNSRQKTCTTYKNIIPLQQQNRPPPMQHVKSVADAIKHLREQIGINLKPSAIFPKIKKRAGRRFFTVELESPVFCSKQYAALEAYANQYKTISVESGGYKLATIFIL